MSSQNQVTRIAVATKLLEAERALGDVRSSVLFDAEDLETMRVAHQAINKLMDKVIPREPS